MVSFKPAYRNRKGPPPGGEGLRRSPDASLAELAARQHGVVAFEQLLALGLTKSGVQRRVEAGRLHRLHRGVYAVGHPRASLDGKRLLFLSTRAGVTALHELTLAAPGNSRALFSQVDRFFVIPD